MEKQISTHFTIEFRLETEPEDDGRWLAEIPEIPGVIVYSEDLQQAIAHVQALALRVIADRLEHQKLERELTLLTLLLPRGLVQ